jgi:hypothetical protein
MGLVGGPIRRSSGILGSVAYALLLPPRPTPFTSVGYVQVDAVAGQGGRRQPVFHGRPMMILERSAVSIY